MSTKQLVYQYMKMYRFTKLHLLKQQLDIPLIHLLPVLDMLEGEGVINRNDEYVHYTGDTV